MRRKRSGRLEYTFWERGQNIERLSPFHRIHIVKTSLHFRTHFDRKRY